MKSYGQGNNRSQQVCPSIFQTRVNKTRKDLFQRVVYFTLTRGGDGQNEKISLVESCQAAFRKVFISPVLELRNVNNFN